MGGGTKKTTRNAAIQRSQQTTGLEHQRAAELHGELQARKATVAPTVYDPAIGSYAKAGAGAEDLRATGGFNPDEVTRIKAKQDLLGGEEGYGREGYQDLAVTGGFTPDSKSEFLQSATSPIAAMYARTKDEMNRRLSLQGGYSPGFTAGAARLARQGAQAGSEAGLNARVSLEDQIRQGKLAGLGGLERTRTAIGGERQAAAGEARALETSIASGKSHGQDMLQRYSEQGSQALNQADIEQLQNRLQSGQLSTADSQLLAAISANEKGLFDKIMQGVSTVAGAIGGAAPAFK